MVAEGYTVHCAIGEDFRPVPIPESFRDVVEQFEQRAGG